MSGEREQEKEVNGRLFLAPRLFIFLATRARARARHTIQGTFKVVMCNLSGFFWWASSQVLIGKKKRRGVGVTVGTHLSHTVQRGSLQRRRNPLRCSEQVASVHWFASDTITGRYRRESATKNSFRLANISTLQFSLFKTGNRSTRRVMSACM